jgi:hypothetical protein
MVGAFNADMAIWRKICLCTADRYLKLLRTAASHLGCAGTFAAIQSLRTPDERFADLPEFPYSATYCEVDDGDGGQLRVAWRKTVPPKVIRC